MTKPIAPDTLIERLRTGEWQMTVIQGPNPTMFTTDETETVRKAARQLQLCREALRNIAFTAVPLKSDSEETLRNNSQVAANIARRCLASIEGVGE